MLRNYVSRTVPPSSWRNQPHHNKVQGKPCVGKFQCCSRSLYEHLSNNSSLLVGHKSCEGSCYVVITLMDELGELQSSLGHTGELNYDGQYLVLAPQRIRRIVNDGCSWWQTGRMRASLGPPGTWQSRYSFRVRVPWGPGSPMREGVTRRMQTDLGGFTMLGNDNNIYICSIAPSGLWFETMDIIYTGNQLSHSAQTSGRDINVFKSKTRDYNILPRPCCILIFSYTTSAPHISLLEY